MFSLQDPKNNVNYEIITNRQFIIIDLIKKYRWPIPLNILNELKITENELNYVKGALLTPRVCIY